jgi:putative addiction module antidote
MAALKLTQIGNSVGVILPKEVLAKLKVEKGDTLYITETPGGVTLTPYDPAFEEQLELGSARWPNELALDRQAAADPAARRKPG